MLTHLKLGYGGRLANQMFQIAGIIGLARRCDHTFAFPYWMNYEHKDQFGSKEDIDVQSWFKNKLPVLTEREGFWDVNLEFNTIPETFYIGNAANEKINITQQWSGHLQSYKWFDHCKDLVRHYFQFDTDKLKEHLAHVPGWYAQKNVCGIHVRIGDYANADSMQPVLTTDYYHKAMEKTPFPTTFIVFSDQPDKAREIIEPTGMTCIYVKGNHYLVDLYLMTQCENFIIGNSTFSWWGAWLINNLDKKIVAPSTWWTEKTVAQWGYSTKHLFPPEWIVI